MTAMMSAKWESAWFTLGVKDSRKVMTGGLHREGGASLMLVMIPISEWTWCASVLNEGLR